MANSSLGQTDSPKKREGVHLELKAEAIVEREDVYLTDVAQCSGDPRLCAEAHGIYIGNLSGRQKILKKSLGELQMVLATEWPLEAATLEGAPSTVVRRSTADATSEDRLEEILRNSIKDALTQALAEARMDEFFRVGISDIKVPLPLKKNGDSLLKFEPRIDLSSLGRKAWIRAHLRGAQKIEGIITSTRSDLDRKVFSISTHLVLLERLPVAAHPLVRGTTLKDDDLEWAWYEHGSSDPVAFEMMDDLVGQKLKINIMGTHPFPKTAVERPKIVQRGHLAQLSVKRGSLSISGRVETTQSGALGDVIDAVSIATKKRIKVRVIGPNAVEMIF